MMDVLAISLMVAWFLMGINVGIWWAEAKQ